MLTLKKSQTIAAVATTLALAGPGLASAAAVDYFLKIDGIDGESTDDKHKGEIEIESWSWGVTQSTAGAGGSRAGKACTSPVSFSKPVDKATPPLMANAVSGMVIPRAILIGRKAGGKEQQEYLKIELKNVMVTSYQTGGSNANLPMDQFSLNFANMTVEYRVQNPDGSLGNPISASFQGGC